MVNPPHSNDPILQKLEELPDKWNGDKKQIKLNLIVHKKDADWISSIIYEKIEEGLLSANLDVKHSKHSVEMSIVLSVTVDLTPIITTLSLLLYEIKTKTISNYLGRRRRRKVKN